MAKKAGKPSKPPGALSGVLGGLSPPPPGPPAGGVHHYQWLYRCTWTLADGHHLYSSLHAVITTSDTNYQQASAQARAEALAGLPDSAAAEIGRHIGVQFHCHREGAVIPLD